MKSAFAATVAAAALISTAQSQTYFKVKGAANYETTLSLEAQINKDCGNAQAINRSVNKNAYGTTILFVSTQDACDPVPKEDSKLTYTEYTDAAEISALAACFPSSVFTPGKNGQFCPIPFTKTCVADQWCQNFGGAGQLCDAADPVCRYPVPKAMLIAASEFEGPWAQYTLPTSVGRAMGMTIGLNCAVYDFTTPTSLPNKDNKKISQAYPIINPASCNTAAITIDVRTAIDAWNASPEGIAAPYPAVSGTFTTTTQADYLACYDSATNKFGCVINGGAGCALPCPNKTTGCTSDSQCGAYCKVDPAQPDSGVKVCLSSSASSLSALVAPVLAAVVAFAFF